MAYLGRVGDPAGRHERDPTEVVEVLGDDLAHTCLAHGYREEEVVPPSARDPERRPRAYRAFDRPAARINFTQAPGSIQSLRHPRENVGSKWGIHEAPPRGYRRELHQILRRYTEPAPFSETLVDQQCCELVERRTAHGRVHEHVRVEKSRHRAQS